MHSKKPSYVKRLYATECARLCLVGRTKKRKQWSGVLKKEKHTELGQTGEDLV